MSSEIEEKEMQTVVSTYVAPDLTDDTKLDDVNYEYRYSEIDRLSPDVDEKINVDDDREEELVITDDVTESPVEQSNGDRRDSFEPSWHPHVYGKPPKKPTPHTIEYILGISNQNETNKSVSQLMNVKRSFDVRNLTEKHVQTDDRRYNISLHKNKLQDQLLQRSVRTSESDFDGKVYGVKCEEQPLNLSVPKAKESPGWTSGTDEDKICKGKAMM